MKRFAVIIASMIFVSCSKQETGSDNQESLKFEQFINSFDAGSMRGRRPSTDPLSDSSFNIALIRTENQLKDLLQIDTAFLSKDEKIDWRFAHSLLSGRRLEIGRMRFYKRDPRMYLLFTGISDVIARPGKVEEKIT